MLTDDDAKWLGSSAYPSHQDSTGRIKDEQVNKTWSAQGRGQGRGDSPTDVDCTTTEVGGDCRGWLLLEESRPGKEQRPPAMGTKGSIDSPSIPRYLPR